MDTKIYWAQVHATEATLTDSTYLVQVAHGNLIVTDAASAAICLVQETHRKATDAEIDAYEAAQAAQREAALEAAKPALPQVNIVLDEALAATLKASAVPIETPKKK